MNKNFKNNQISVVTCGSLMLGVSVPVIIAAHESRVALGIGIGMLFIGIALISCVYTHSIVFGKILLSIHIIFASIILCSTTFLYIQHEEGGTFFLMFWSLAIIFTAIFGWKGLKMQG